DNIQINNYNINYINDYENIINNVKLEEVKKLANSLLEPQNLFFVKVGKST
ncbi:MAG: insulinase family protein, partial [Wolbachia pipientis]|nr:insulinase family protein [Wolbachia pipientis]